MPWQRGYPRIRPGRLQNRAVRGGKKGPHWFESNADYLNQSHPQTNYYSVNGVACAPLKRS